MNSAQHDVTKWKNSIKEAKTALILDAFKPLKSYFQKPDNSAIYRPPHI